MSLQLFDPGLILGSRLTHSSLFSSFAKGPLMLLTTLLSSRLRNWVLLAMARPGRGRKPSARLVRPPRATGYRPRLENLEDRTLLSTLDVTGGSLTYTASAGVANSLTIGVSGTAYTFDDTGETITLTANAMNAGW